MRRLEQPILDALPYYRTDSILDVGCGDGWLLSQLKRMRYLNYFGIERDSDVAKRARKLHGDRVVQSDVLWGRDMTPKHQCILLCDVLEHIPIEDVGGLLHKLYRNLERGKATAFRGTLIIRTPNAEGICGSRLRYSDPDHQTAYTRQSLKTLLTDAGFTDIEFYEAKPIVHGPVSFIRRGLWEVISLCWRCLVAVETGEFGALASSNLICVAR